MAESVHYWICSCGKSNLKGARRCSACRKRRPLSWGFYALAAIGVIVLVALMIPSPEEGETAHADIPAAQVEFLAAIERAKREIRQAPNSLAASETLASRDFKLAELASVSDWRGSIAGIQQMQGKGAVAIDLGGVEIIAGVYLLLGLDTLISPGRRELYGQLLSLRAGDEVVVSGRFVELNGSLVELSYTGYGSVSSPQFLFDFSRISPTEQ